MQPSVYRQFIELEDTHWWFVARRELVADRIAPYFPNKAERALDIGCGTGATLGFLSRFCKEAHGFDASDLALGLARGKYPSAHLIRGDANELWKHFQYESFDLITVLNVLYHEWIQDEVKVMAQVRDLLKPGGVFVVTEPAFRFLMREHDQQVMGRTRYNRTELRTMLERAGFAVERVEYFNAFSFLPATLLSLVYGLKRRLGLTSGGNKRVQEVESPHPFLNAALQGLLSLERKAGKMPFGVSLIAVARKKA